MTRQRLTLWLSAIAIAVPAQALAQSSAAARPTQSMQVSINDLVARALDRAPGMQARRLQIDRARAEAQQAALRANPMLSTERRTEIGGSDTMTAVGIEWPLELFRRSARVASATAQVAAATADVGEAERQLAGEVRRRAVELMIAGRRLALADEIAANLRETHESLTRRVAEGAAPPLIRDQAYVEWQRVEAQRPARRADVRAASSDLCAVVGLPADTPLAITDDFSGVSAPPPSASTVDLRADVRAAVARVAAASAGVSEAKQHGRFDLGVFGGYSRMNSGFSQFGLSPEGTRVPIHGVFHNVSLGVSVMVPIANRNQGAVAAARATERAAELEKDAALLSASADLASARARDEEAQSAVGVYESGLRTTARKNLDVVRESFSLGRLTLTDVLAEQRRYLDIEMGYIDALAAAFTARANLLQAQGVIR